MVLLLIVERLVLKERRGDLSGRAGAALTVDEISEHLFRPLALKVHMTAVGQEDIEIAEALHSQKRVALRHDRETQVSKLRLNLLLCDRLHDVAARVQPHRVACILREAGDKDDVHLRVDLFQLFCQLYAVHAAHMDIKKGDITAVLSRVRDKIVLIVIRCYIRVGLCFPDSHLKHLKHQRFVVNA